MAFKRLYMSALGCRDPLNPQSVLVYHSTPKAAVQAAAFGTEADDRVSSPDPNSHRNERPQRVTSGNCT